MRRRVLLGFGLLVLVALLLLVGRDAPEESWPDRPEGHAAPVEEVVEPGPEVPPGDEPPEIVIHPWREAGLEFPDPLAGEGEPVTGRVVRPDGTPVAGADVVLFDEYFSLRLPGVPASRSWQEYETPAVRTREDGAFSFSVHVAGRLNRSVPAGGLLVRATLGEEASRTVPAVLGGENGAVGDLVLLPAFVPEVVVVTDGGAPVSGAVVRLTLWAALDDIGLRSDQYTCFEGRTDDAGRTRFPVAIRRRDWRARVEVAHPEHGRTEVRALDRAAPWYPGAGLLAWPIRVELATGMTVVGRVLLPEGAPAAGYQIKVGRRERAGQLRMPIEISGFVEHDGTFEVRGVPRERGVLNVRENHGELGHLVEIPAAEGRGVVELGEIRLPRLGSIRGRALDEAGQPAADCRVIAFSSPGDYVGYRSDRSDADGRFEIAGLPPRTYRLSVAQKLEEDDEVRGRLDGVSPDGPEVTVRLSRAGSLLFVFRSRERPGDPLQIPSYEIRYSQGGWSGHGTVTRRRIYPAIGTWEFEVESTGYRKVDLGAIEVLPDRDRVIDVFLERAR